MSVYYANRGVISIGGCPPPPCHTPIAILLVAFHSNRCCCLVFFFFFFFLRFRPVCFCLPFLRRKSDVLPSSSLTPTFFVQEIFFLPPAKRRATLRLINPSSTRRQFCSEWRIYDTGIDTSLTRREEGSEVGFVRRKSCLFSVQRVNSPGFCTRGSFVTHARGIQSFASFPGSGRKREREREIFRSQKGNWNDWNKENWVAQHPTL